MNARKRLSAASIAALFALICCTPKNLSADPPDSDLVMIVTSPSGAQRRIASYDHQVGRVGLSPGQLVTVTLQFPTDRRGSQLSLASFDGGEVSSLPDNSDLYVAEDGTVLFQYRGGHAPGLYRLTAHLIATDYNLEFYVLDTARLENNPPRVRVVD